MPIYEFHCGKCERDSEILVRSTDWKETGCPHCGSKKLSKKFSTFASAGGGGEAPSGNGGGGIVVAAAVAAGIDPGSAVVHLASPTAARNSGCKKMLIIC